jgi:hypothetical protein
VREVLEDSVEEGELVGFREQHLANLLCVFVELGYNPGEEWMGLYRRALAGVQGASDAGVGSFPYPVGLGRS